MPGPRRPRTPGPGAHLGARTAAGVGRAGGQSASVPRRSTRLGGAPGDLLLAVWGADAVTSPALHVVRSARHPAARAGAQHRTCLLLDRGLPALRARRRYRRACVRAPPLHGAASRRLRLSRERSRRAAARCTTTLCITATSWAVDPSASPTPPCSVPYFACLASRRRIRRALRVSPRWPRRRRAAAWAASRSGFDRIAMLLAGAASLARRDRVSQDHGGARSLRRAPTTGQPRRSGGAAPRLEGRSGPS